MGGVGNNRGDDRVGGRAVGCEPVAQQQDAGLAHEQAFDPAPPGFDDSQVARYKIVEHGYEVRGLHKCPRAGEMVERQNHTCSAEVVSRRAGIVTSLAALPDPRLDDLLVAAGELTWAAGPLAKGPGLCHRTAGNGYAFLKLFKRTGDERWLDRARAFAMHAIAQSDRDAAEYGRRR
jgi:Lanthionine synthetase C-like protein